MMNRWATKDDPIACWSADLTDAMNDPERLWLWLRATLELGDKLEVYSVQEAPLAGFLLERDGPFVNFLEKRFRETRELDLFAFAQSGMRRIGSSRFRTLARVASFDSDGSLVEKREDDLGALLRRLRPEDLGADLGSMKHCEPVCINGTKIRFDSSGGSSLTPHAGQMRIEFILYSDIWFPWIPGMIEESYQYGKLFDNRELAQRHTPRLNEFLSLVREHTLQLGGQWERDAQYDLPELPGMLNESGIRLDVDPFIENRQQ